MYYIQNEIESKLLDMYSLIEKMKELPSLYYLPITKNIIDKLEPLYYYIYDDNNIKEKDKKIIDTLYKICMRLKMHDTINTINKNMLTALSEYIFSLVDEFAYLLAKNDVNINFTSIDIANVIYRRYPSIVKSFIAKHDIDKYIKRYENMLLKFNELLEKLLSKES